MEGIADFHDIKDFNDINYFHGILFIVQRVQYINQIKGRQFVSSEQILNYLANPETPDIHREIFFTFKEHGVFSEDRGLTIQDAADLMVKDKDYLGIQLGIMASIGFLSKSVQIKQSEVNNRKYKLKSYYLSRQHLSPVSQTALSEKVFTKVEPVTCEIKATKSKKAPINSKIQEVFDLFNQELIKVFGEAKKLKVLNDKRKKDIQKILDLDLDNQKMFRGFFVNRKETDNNYLDIHYVLRNPEHYLNYSGSTNDKKETEEERRAKIKWEKRKEESQRFLAEQRGFHEVAEPNKTKKRFQIV